MHSYTHTCFVERMCLYMFVNLTACFLIHKHFLTGAWEVWLIHPKTEAQVTSSPAVLEPPLLAGQGRLLWLGLVGAVMSLERLLVGFRGKGGRHPVCPCHDSSVTLFYVSFTTRRHSQILREQNVRQYVSDL